LSGVSKVVEDNTDEEETKVARMDERIAWEVEEGWESKTFFFIC